ncbi:MAG TPA: hypothetical protein VK716_15410 [Terracidiphilus sp.]|nr:hypothetical protein [Terracidiphilus sp.]
MSFRDRFSFAKIVVFFAVAFAIGVGLCGIDFFLASHNIGKSHDEFGVGPLDGVSLLVMFFSAVGLAITLVARFIAALFGLTGSGRDDGNPQALFHSSDDSSKSDDPR